MQNLRIINSDELGEALQKGFDRAKEILEQTPSDQNQQVAYLKKEFQRVSRIAEMLLDNFDRAEFFARKNNKKPASDLKLMILAAFEAVNCLSEIHNSLSKMPIDSSVHRDSLAAHRSNLLSGYYIYVTNGEGQQENIDDIRRYFYDLEGDNHNIPSILEKQPA